MKMLTQKRYNAIASALNNRPRKSHGFRTQLVATKQLDAMLSPTWIS
jgi:IS30 family transposase